MFQASVDAAHEFLADHAAHRAAHEAELEGRGDQRQAHQLAAHHDQRILFLGILARLGQALGVLAAVLELERIGGAHFRRDLHPRLGIEKVIEPRPRSDDPMRAAFRTHFQGALQFGAVQHRLATVALHPQAFGYALLAHAAGQQFRSRDFFQPAHRNAIGSVGNYLIAATGVIFVQC